MLTVLWDRMSVYLSCLVFVNFRCHYKNIYIYTYSFSSLEAFVAYL